MAKKTTKSRKPKITAKQAALNKAYRKEYNRIMKLIRRATARGYAFQKSVIPKPLKRPTQRSIEKLVNLTADYLYSKSTYQGSATDYRKVKGTEARKAERSKSAKRSAETRRRKKAETKPIELPEIQTSEPDTPSVPTTPEPEINQVQEPSLKPKIPTADDEDRVAPMGVWEKLVISNFKFNYKHFDSVANLMDNWLNKMIEEYGEHDVALMIQKANEANHILTYDIAYEYNKLLNFLDSMMNYMPNMGPFFKAQMMEALEEDDFWEEYE